MWRARSSRPYNRSRSARGFVAKRNGLSESDFNILSELGEKRLEGRFEAETCSWGEVGGDDDVLDILVSKAVEIEVSRQPAA